MRWVVAAVAERYQGLVTLAPVRAFRFLARTLDDF
jgi:hypothetical protein